MFQTPGSDSRSFGRIARYGRGSCHQTNLELHGNKPSNLSYVGIGKLSRLVRAGRSVAAKSLSMEIEPMTQDRFRDYRARDALLHLLGFASYAEYLKSPTWQRARRRVLERACGLCEKCGAKATEVHHLKYSREVLLGYKRNLRHLMAICRQCHQQGEFAGGKKVSRTEANRRLERPGLNLCPVCDIVRAWTDFENFSGTQVYNFCKSCRSRTTGRAKARKLGLSGMRPKYPRSPDS
jgi:hypothetical protein